MDTLRPLRWKEGMFLRPQHFQQLDQFLEAREAARLRALDAHSWGLVWLDLNGEVLGSYTLEVKRLRAVLPDGTFVDVPRNARVPSLHLADALRGAVRPVPVLLGLRRGEPRVPHAQAGDDPSRRTRFTIVEEEVYDADSGEGPVPVELLRYELRLFVEGEPADGYETLPLVQVLSTGNPAQPVALDPVFAPPCMVVGASPALMSKLRAVASQLGVVLREMQQRGLSADPKDPLLFSSLASSLPVVAEIAADGQIAPRTAYLELARLAGALLFRRESQWSEGAVPGYNHETPAPVFERLRQMIEELSQWVIAERWRRVSMHRSGDLFQVTLPLDMRRPGVRLFLEVKADVSTAQVRPLLGNATVSAGSRIEFLKSFALPGIANEAMPGPPPEIQPDPVASYFRLKLEGGDEWTTKVATGEDLTASVLNAPADLTINLIVIFPRSED